MDDKDGKVKDQERVQSLERVVSTTEGEIFDNADGLRRRLGVRQIQLLTIGGAIGTGLFMTIGTGLAKGGPAGLLLGFIVYATFVALVNNGMAEMATYMPVSGGFIRKAGKWVDDAVGFMAGWNFFFFEALGLPFEITALSIAFSFWSHHIPEGAITAGCIVVYSLVNFVAVGVYGEVEFWLSGGKVLLIFILFFFTFVTMVGGNPQHDAYGFRYWRNPGAFNEWRTTGATGRFEGFLAAMFLAPIIIVGPEYLSMASAEVKHPRRYVKDAYKTMYWRFGLFFIGGALCVGIVAPHNDKTLLAIVSGTQKGGTAAASPYVIAMKNMGIGVLPSITNALIATSIFSAGNTYTYCGTRSLYGLALEGRAPKILAKCNSKGVPIYSLAVMMAFACLAFLQLSSGSTVVLNWLVNLITAATLINYMTMCVTYLFFFRACQVQGLDRKTLSYYGWGQPYCALAGLISMTLVLIVYGYSSFSPWSVSDFFTYYGMVIVAIFTYSGWKIFKRTKVVSPHEADIIWDSPIIDAYESAEADAPIGFWQDVLSIIWLPLRKKAKENV